MSAGARERPRRATAADAPALPRHLGMVLEEVALRDALGEVRVPAAERVELRAPARNKFPRRRHEKRHGTPASSRACRPRSGPTRASRRASGWTPRARWACPRSRRASPGPRRRSSGRPSSARTWARPWARPRRPNRASASSPWSSRGRGSCRCRLLNRRGCCSSAAPPSPATSPPTCAAAWSRCGPRPEAPTTCPDSSLQRVQ